MLDVSKNLTYFASLSNIQPLGKGLTPDPHLLREPLRPTPSTMLILDSTISLMR
jgi:hypothetical protein